MSRKQIDPNDPFLAIGIDPGLSGAVAYINHTRALVYNMKTRQSGDGQKIVSFMDIFEKGICKGPIRVITIEKVHANPSFGSKGSFAFGRAVGAIDAALELIQQDLLLLGAFWACSKADIQYVTPQAWKKHYGLLSDRKKGLRVDKRDSIPKALEWYPHAEIKNHNQADAILIARYGLTQEGEKK